MRALTQKEKEIALLLFKDFSTFYNSNSASAALGISRIGAMKIMNRLFRENLLVRKVIGKSVVYKLNLNENHTIKFIEFLLSDESKDLKRWKEEFKELYTHNRVIIIFGSILKNYKEANDIDLMIVDEYSNLKEADLILEKKEKILPKRLHTIKLTFDDLLQGLKKKDKIILDIIKNGVVLNGWEKYTEVLKNVSTI